MNYFKAPNGEVYAYESDAHQQQAGLALVKMTPQEVEALLAPATPSLEEQKKAKLAQINALAQAFINQVAGLDSVPDFELRTWILQGEEAKAWSQNKTAPTPTLDTIAQSRGVPPEVLKAKALEKTRRFEFLVASVAGQRQRYEDLNERADSVDAVKAITPVFKLATQLTTLKTPGD